MKTRRVRRLVTGEIEHWCASCSAWHEAELVKVIRNPKGFTEWVAAVFHVPLSLLGRGDVAVAR